MFFPGFYYAALALSTAAVTAGSPEHCKLDNIGTDVDRPKRAAIVLRGDSWRGLQGLAFLASQHPRKSWFLCTPEAEEVQMAIARAHVAHWIEPLESCGMKVDILMSINDCTGKRSKEEARTMLNNLVKVYAGTTSEGKPARTVVNETLSRGEGHVGVKYTAAQRDKLLKDKTVGTQNDALALAGAFLDKWIKESHAVYDMIIMSRYDSLPHRHLPTACHMPLEERDISCHYEYRKPFDYARCAPKEIYIFDDQVLSFPGTAARCVIDLLLDMPIRAETRSDQVFAPLIKLLSGEMDVEINMGEVLGEPATYRGPFGQWDRLPELPHQDQKTYRECITVRDSFGGPSCDVEYLLTAVCRAFPQQRDVNTEREFVDGFFKRLAVGRNKPGKKDGILPAYKVVHECPEVDEVEPEGDAEL